MRRHGEWRFCSTQYYFICKTMQRTLLRSRDTTWTMHCEIGVFDLNPFRKWKNLFKTLSLQCIVTLEWYFTVLHHWNGQFSFFFAIFILAFEAIGRRTGILFAITTLDIYTNCILNWRRYVSIKHIRHQYIRDRIENK